MHAQAHRPQPPALDRRGTARHDQGRTGHDWLEGTNYFRVPNALADSGMLASLRAASLRVLLQMLRMLNVAGECWPSQQLLAARCGLDVRTVRRAIDELIAAQLVIRVRRGRTGRATLYRVNAGSAEAGVHTPTKPIAPQRGARDGASRGARTCASKRTLMPASSGPARPTNNTHEQDTTLTPRRSRGAAATQTQVCAAFVEGWEAKIADTGKPQARNIRDLCAIAAADRRDYSARHAGTGADVDDRRRGDADAQPP